MSEPAVHLIEAFEAKAPVWAAHEPAWLTGMRRAAIDRFAAEGLPTSRNEEFKHTPLTKIFDRDVRLGTPRGEAWLEDPLPRIDESEVRIVFRNGRLDAAASDLKDLPVGITLRSLGQALRDAGDGVPDWLAPHLETNGRSLAALNAACMEDGALITVAKGAEITRPLHLVYLTTKEASARIEHLRNVIRAAPGSRIQVVEHYPRGSGDGVNNAMTGVTVGRGATVHLVKIQDEGPETDHLAAIDVRVEEGGKFLHHSLARGASTGRTEVRVTLAGKGAECDLAGVYLGRERQVQDQLTLVTHAEPDCVSRQVYRGILDDRARGIFNGLVVVARDAQRTAAEQNNRSLLLSEGAEAHARPQLLIDADDVKCAHGATVGSLDDESMFYLRSRGIGPEEARRMLVQAFAREVLETLPEGTLRTRLEGMIAEWLGA